jgi:gliding motility-associated-like protein
VGVYVVTVCVNEIRNGVVIATQRKDLQIHIADCEIAAASLEPEYMLCGNTQTISLMNLSTSPLITSYDWFIIDNTGNTIYSSTSTTVNYTFADTGIYSVKLVINRGQGCTDSAASPIKVYPGFNPDFTSTGICITKPTLYTDRTTSVYGIVNSWSWDFGEPGITPDVSNLQNPVYTYPTMGIKNISLTATDTKGCKGTIIKSITVIDKPPLNLLFKDTLICINDPVQLQSSSPGIFSWSPNINIINAGTAAPTVSPTVTTMYYVDLDDNGCQNRDSVRVRVTDHVNLQAMADTTICSGDAVQLRIISDGFQYAWTPPAQLNNAALPNPIAIANATTTYRVTANIGSCVATEQIVVTAVPYPLANAGPDLIICYNARAQLNGQTDGRTFQWSPASLLNNAAILNPQTRQLKNSASFTLLAHDTRGCPKPGRDTILVTVLPKINASAGRDTAVITGQPLQLNAGGGEFYSWSPAQNLSDADIPNPVAVFNSPSPGLLYKVLVYDEGGCVDSSSITIKVFATGPSIFVPTAFTPNGDARNDLLKPIAAGISGIEYFKIFNRWGQLVFSTSTNGHGWDGKIGGQPQPTNTFTWIVKATDYRGRTYFQKGITTLIR